MKVAIIIGHAHDRRGADSVWLEPEFDYNTDVANYLKELAPCMYHIFFHSGYKKGYSAMIKATANRINQGDFDLVIELHYNMAASSTANGCMFLYHYNSKKGKEWAEKLSKGVSSVMDVKNLGAKPLKSTDNGYLAVTYPNPPALIAEPFFGSNKSDSQKFDEEKEKRRYAQAIHHSIVGIPILT